MITGLVASGLPETPCRRAAEKAGSDQQNWFVYDFILNRVMLIILLGTWNGTAQFCICGTIRFCGSAHCFSAADPTGCPGRHIGSLKGFSSGNTDHGSCRADRAAAVICPKGSNWKALMMRSIRWRNLDGMFARLEDAFEAERQFTDDASHDQ